MIIALAAVAAIALQRQTATTHAAQSANSLGLHLLQVLDRTRSRSTSLVISPYSADAAFAALLVGLQGKTRSRLANVLSLSKAAPSAVEQSYQDVEASFRNIAEGAKFTSSNSFWLAPEVLSPEAYRQRLQQSFNADIMTLRGLDAVGATQVNDWITDRTKGEITHMLDRVPKGSAFLLVNTALFSGRWERRTGIRPMSFTLEGGAVAAAKGLFLEAQLPYVEDDTWQAAALAYQGARFAFVIAKPKTADIGPALAAMSVDRWNHLLDHTHTKLGRVTWPEFKFTSNTDLLWAMSKLGAANLQFPSMDFAPIMGRKGLLTAAVQRAMIDVDKNGTKASAATVIVGSFGGAPRPPSAFEGFTLVADKPFLFAIVDRETKACLFLGIYAGPSD
ncbi:MAG TPA: serpin family protein [Fimbriimonadaceae bacterium]|nr:serpin family protein [Fimbriimonadaceae bacterium]